MKGKVAWTLKCPRLVSFGGISFRRLSLVGILGFVGFGSFAVAQDQNSSGTLHTDDWSFVALGPITDRTEYSVTILGSVFTVSEAQTSILTLGDYVLVEGSISDQGKFKDTYRLHVLDQQYVPGASSVAKVYLGEVEADLTGTLALSGVSVDINAVDHSSYNLGACASELCVVAVVGTQPLPGGPILAEVLFAHSQECFPEVESMATCGSNFAELLNDTAVVFLGASSAAGSLGTGKANGSLGTGKASGSLGTGKANGSLGTGKASGSLGTGKANGSLGTGKASGSLGTGKANGSLGTGKASGSLGTGKANGSLGTGKASAPLGTGRGSASVATGIALTERGAQGATG